LFFWFL